jgi:aspartyl-tRNA(Asn)/glutamyl-tRNA(Gln) amidotransferase subunit A
MPRLPAQKAMKNPLAQKIPSAARLLSALDAVTAAGDEGGRIFLQLYQEAAGEAAAAADQRAARGMSLGPLDGRIVSIKDLFDVAGEPTTAGSKLLKSAQVAKADAPVVQRLRAAGAVIIGKTGMSEFAYSGIGLNPHYGTPGNACNVGHVPGGSSSGAGVSVARGMAEIAIGTDTGGSVRIPSALNGVVGFKPTQARVPRDGAFPLSFTLDTIGPLARSVIDCAQADAVLSGSSWQPLPAREVAGLRIGVPRGFLFTHCDDAVLAAFEAAINAISHAGARVQDVAFDAWLEAPSKLQENGTMVAAEAAHIHRDLLDSRASEYDPFVHNRIRRGLTLSAAQYVGIQQARATLMAQLDVQLAGLDLLLVPTVPILAPRIDALANDAAAFAIANALILRNPSVFNFYDLPAISLPLPRLESELAVGLMVVGKRHADSTLLALARALKKVLG